MALVNVWVGLKFRSEVEVPPLTFQGHPEIVHVTPRPGTRSALDQVRCHRGTSVMGVPDGLSRILNFLWGNGYASYAHSFLWEDSLKRRNIPVSETSFLIKDITDVYVQKYCHCNLIFYEISGYHGGEDVDARLLDCSAVWNFK
jgi:hypothetical protein